MAMKGYSESEGAFGERRGFRRSEGTHGEPVVGPGRGRASASGKDEVFLGQCPGAFLDASMQLRGSSFNSRS
jgi:hypothetical protein